MMPSQVLALLLSWIQLVVAQAPAEPHNGHLSLPFQPYPLVTFSVISFPPTSTSIAEPVVSTLVKTMTNWVVVGDPTSTPAANPNPATPTVLKSTSTDHHAATNMDTSVKTVVVVATDTKTVYASTLATTTSKTTATETKTKAMTLGTMSTMAKTTESMTSVTTTTKSKSAGATTFETITTKSQSTTSEALATEASTTEAFTTETTTTETLVTNTSSFEGATATEKASATTSNAALMEGAPVKQLLIAAAFAALQAVLA